MVEMKKVGWARYSSKLIASGFELKSDSGDPLSVCPAAEWDFVDREFAHEFDHGEAIGHLRLVSMAKDPSDGMPIATYDVSGDIHKLIQSDNFKGISPVIKVNEVNDNSKTFTNYTVTGISFQFEAKPACPDSFCPTEYKGGDSVTKDLETDEDKDENKDKDKDTKTEEPPKVVKQVVVKKTPATEAVEQTIESTKGTDEAKNEFIAKLMRQNEEYEKRLKTVEADLEAREAEIRKELLESIPEEHRAFAEKLEDEALTNVANILNKDRAAAKETKDAATVIESGAVETTDQKKKPEETTETEEPDPEKEERDFFDRSGVFTVSEEKSGIWSR